MKLDDYLHKNRITQAAFGIRAGFTQGHISQIIAGRMIPKGSKARCIAEATNWQVTPHELNPVDYPNPTDGLPPEHQSKTNG